MADTSIASYRTYVEDYVDGASDETTTTDRAIVDTVRDFCRFTHLWKETLPLIDIVADQSNYTLNPSTDHCDVPKVLGLDEVMYKEDGLDNQQFAPIDIVSREWLDTYDKQWVYRTSPVPRMAAFDHLVDEVFLIDKPTVASTEGLFVRVWLWPDKSATTAPTSFFEKYYKAIAQGSAAEMMRMPNQRWSNPELGDHYHDLYMAERMNAQQDQDRGFADIENYRVIPERAFTGGSRGSTFPTGTGVV